MKKNIVIYTHAPFENNNGGIVVQYFLAYLLDKFGMNVKICNEHDNKYKNSIFNKFISINEIDNDNTIVIYSEGISGNPLKSKYVVRWILSKLGQNVPIDYYFTWEKNDLVYFFNSEIELIEKNVKFKMLSLFYLDKKIKNLNFKRNCMCYTKRKNYIHSKINKIHTNNAFEITKKHNYNDYIEIFNKHKMFISYDPLTFLNLIASICGCISVIYPIEGISKKKYLMMTSLYEYLNENNTELYGIAYGMEESELLFAKQTIHLAEEQFKKIQQWFIDKYIINFINDINNFDKNENKVSYYNNISYFKNNSFNHDLKNTDLIDIDFYKKYNTDLSNLSFQEIIHHYKYYGKEEGRFGSEKQIKDFVEDQDFDIDFYKKYNTDLSNLSFQEIIHHYKYYGKKENRFASEKQIKDFVEDQDFDIDFYKMMYNEKLVGLNTIEIFLHYINYGMKKGYFCSEKQVKDFVQDPDFDIKFYKIYNPDLIGMSYHLLVEHYKAFGKKNKRISSEKKLREFAENEITCSYLNEFQLLYNVSKKETKYLSKINKKINKIKESGEILHIDKTSNTEIYTLYINWLKVITETKKMVINSPINNELICTDKYFIMCNTQDELTKYSICNYYFEDEKIILGLGLGSGNHPQECYILYVYSFYKNKIFYGWLNYSFENFKKNNMVRIIDFICNVKKYNFNKVNSTVKTFYGLCNNMGHALFNEYTGLYILKDYNIIKNIDEVIQGPFDVYHISNYLKQFTNININYVKNIDNLNYVIGKGILFKFNHHFITNKCISFLKKNLYDIYSIVDDYKNINILSKNIKKNYYPIINIVLRKGDYEMNNQSTTISQLINMIIKKYPKAFFYFDGFVSNNSNEKEIFLGINSSQNISNIKNKYIDLVDEIVKKIDTNNYLSLIDMNISYLITHINNSSYAIYTLSSASCNGGWICKTPGIQFGRPSIHIYKWMDKIIREGNLDINYYNDKITYDENGNFSIDAETIFNLLPKF